MMDITKSGRCSALALTLLALSAGAFGHPHSFITLESQMVVENDALAGLAMRWTMDEMTSADLLYDAGGAAPDSPVWKKLAAEVMANVLGQHYFTEFWHGDRKVTFSNLPRDYRLAREGNKAVLFFTLPLAHPQPLAGQRYRFTTFDPTYYVDMRYDNANSLTLPEALRQRCKLNLNTPEPDAKLQAWALSLDKEDAPPQEMELGKHFAQQVTLTCQ
ncbi:DUF1007 family protein [Jejubacter calystegiae]|uniref:DUF1007 family protein n=2 Tax=Jejubacter calystegiae TaxID=2579935 RepID=A0A4P8YRB1_9ENTR|nr:DUF1007 family protein [Jejubacter calystegiae]QCT22404.1 DUF1007 family protein [Jejubacter calystegiae]